MIDADEALRAEGYAEAYVEVLELLDAEISKAQSCGDSTSADVIETLRAKVSARGTKSV